LDGYAPSGGGVRGKPALTLAELDAKFRIFLLDVYHRRDNAETKTPPIERWEANGFLPRMPESLEQLDLLLIHVAKARQVRTDGIHFSPLPIHRPLLWAAGSRKDSLGSNLQPLGQGQAIGPMERGPC